MKDGILFKINFLSPSKACKHHPLYTLYNKSCQKQRQRKILKAPIQKYQFTTKTETWNTSTHDVIINNTAFTINNGVKYPFESDQVSNSTNKSWKIVRAHPIHQNNTSDHAQTNQTNTKQTYYIILNNIIFIPLLYPSKSPQITSNPQIIEQPPWHHINIMKPMDSP